MIDRLPKVGPQHKENMKEKPIQEEEVAQKPKVSNLLIRTGSILKVSAAVCKAWGELESAKENAANPYFKSKYAPLKEVIRVAKAVLPKHGLCALQPTTVVEGQKYVMTHILHTSGQYIGGLYPITPGKTDPQAVGSAVTYARRYGLASMLGIASDEDDDGESSMQRGNRETHLHTIALERGTRVELVSLFKGVEEQVNKFLRGKKEITEKQTFCDVRPKLAEEILKRPQDFLGKAVGEAKGA